WPSSASAPDLSEIDLATHGCTRIDLPQSAKMETAMTTLTRSQFSRSRAWTERSTLLGDVAMGRRPADLVVRNGRWVNVHSGEIIAGTDLAIVGGRFAYCGPNAAHAIGAGTKVVDAGGRYLVPGLCDAHMHVE